MSDTTDNKPALWFWIVAGAGLLWNSMGVGKFLAETTVDAKTIAKMSEAAQAMYAARPSWYLYAMGLAIFAGVLGCLLLLARKKWALWMLILSLTGVAVQYIAIWIMTDIGKNQQGFELGMTIIIPIIAIFLVWFARISVSRGWLK